MSDEGSHREGEGEEAQAFEQILAPLRSSSGESLAISLQLEHPQSKLAASVEPPIPSGAPAAIDVDGLGKTFDDEPILENLSFKLYPGEILGLLGPNGAGKTTTLRILATVIKADSGTATLCGHPLTDYKSIRPLIGYMPDILGDYDDLKVDEYMQFFARAYDIKPKDRGKAIDLALERVEMLVFRSHQVNELSRGQKQRLALGRLLLHDPKVLLLDEPASGLDPKARVHLRNLLSELKKDGKTIIISSHILEDLADICQKIAILDRGRLICFGPTSNLLHQLHSQRTWKIKVRAKESADKIFSYLQPNQDVSELNLSDTEVFFKLNGGDERAEELHQQLFKDGFLLVEFSEVPLTLEDLYLRLIGP